MLTTTLPSRSNPDSSVSGAPTRSVRRDLNALAAVLRSDWIKLSSLRTNVVLLALTAAVSGIAAWATAVLVTDEVLTVSQVFVYPALFGSVFAAVAAILMITSEAQHGTLATALAARPARWLIVASKTVIAVGVGLTLGTVSMAAGAAGAAAGGLAMGDLSAMAATAMWALVYTVSAAVLALGVGLTVRLSSGAISGLLVWWFVAENLILAFAPATVSRFLPFDAGYRMLDVGSDFDTPEIIAAAFDRPQYALIFGAYAVLALVLGTVLLYRRDTN